MPDIQQFGATSESESTSNQHTSSRSTSTTSVNPGVPRKQLFAEKDSATAAINALQQALVGSQTKADAASTIAANAMIDAGNAGASLARAEGEKAAAKADADARAAKVMGTSLQDPQSDLVRFAADRHDRWIAMDAIKKEIDASENVSILDDPLGYLANTIRVPMLKRQYNQQAALQGELTQRITAIEMQTEAARNLDTGITARMERSAADAKAGLAVAQGIAQGQELLARNAAQQINALMSQAALAGKPFEYTKELASLLATHTTSNVGSSDSTTQTTRFTTSEHEAAKKATQQDIDMINAKLLLAGAKPEELYTPARWANLQPKDRAELQKNAMTGSIAFGSTPGDALAFLDKTNRLPNLQAAEAGTPANAVARALVRIQGSSGYQLARTQLQSQQNPAQASAFSKLSPVEQTAAVLDKQLADETRQHMAGDHPNYLAIPTDSPLYFSPTFAAQQPELKDNWVSAYVKQRAATNTSILTQPGGVPMKDILTEYVGRVVALQKVGKSTDIPKLATELSNFTRTGSDLQWDRSGARLLGYPRPKEYVASGHMTDATGKALQVYNPIEVENYGVQNAIRYIRSSSQIGGAAGYPAGLGATQVVGVNKAYPDIGEILGQTLPPFGKAISDIAASAVAPHGSKITYP